MCNVLYPRGLMHLTIFLGEYPIAGPSLVLEKVVIPPPLENQYFFNV